MKLSQAARYFDRTVCQDAYSDYTFRGQLEPFVLFTVDAARVKRRMFSVAPDVVVPERHTMRVDDQVYLMGDSTPDHWEGETIRRNFVLLGADHLARVRTIPQALADEAGLAAWASRDWMQVNQDSSESAEFVSRYSIFFSSAEPVPSAGIIELDDEVYFIREVRRSTSGYLDAMTRELEGPAFEEVTYQAREYDPVADAYIKTPATVRVLRLRWQEAFRYLTRASTDYARGDQILMVLKADMPEVDTTGVFELAEGRFKVVAFTDEGLYYSLHVRRA